MLVPESLNEWKNKKGIAISAGLVVIQHNKILLVHPTNSPWWKTYSIPKGHVDDENFLDAAIRETKEETGIDIKPTDIIDSENNVIDYIDDNGNIYKKVYYFVAVPSQIITKDMIKPQLEEVDWVGFLSKKEAEKRIFGRFKHLLNYLD